MPTSIKADRNPAAAAIKLYQSKPIVKFDPNFNLDAEMYGREATFLAAIEIAIVISTAIRLGVVEGSNPFLTPSRAIRIMTYPVSCGCGGTGRRAGLRSL